MFIPFSCTEWLQAESLRKLPAIVEALETKTVKLEEKNSVLERKVLEMQKTIDHPEVRVQADYLTSNIHRQCQASECLLVCTLNCCRFEYNVGKSGLST